jgi:hypothetical protein
MAMQATGRDGTPAVAARTCHPGTNRTVYFFLEADFFADFLADDLAAGFFFSGTDFHLRSIWGLFVRNEILISY